MSKIAKQILINLFIAAMAICVIMYFVQFKTENPEELIENAIKTNMLSNGEIVFHEKYRHGKWRYDYVIMKYKDEYVYFTTDEYPSNPYDDYNIHDIMTLHFDNGLCAFYSLMDSKGNNGKIIVVSQNDEIEKVQLMHYNAQGGRTSYEIETVRKNGTNIFISQNKAEDQNSIGYLDNYTVEGYDKDGNLIAVNKCANQVRYEMGLYK